MYVRGVVIGLANLPEPERGVFFDSDCGRP